MELVICLLILVILMPNLSSLAEKNDVGTYIVYVNKPESLTTMATEELHDWYQSFLPVMSMEDETSSAQKPSMVYSYRHVPGFALRLTSEQVKAMENNDGIVSVREERTFTLQTTHSPQFLGLNKDNGFWKDSNFGQGVIIGVLDSGIVSGHLSFDDNEMPSSPARWKGMCEPINGTDICDNKIIGFRSFNSSRKGGPMSSSLSSQEEFGHGTHTASTAAGAFVGGATVLGNANGTASGMAPRAHLAVYQVCGGTVGCLESDVLAGFDAAVDDVVDVISISLAGCGSRALYHDAIAIGSFSAMKRGIFVSCAAGNSGPYNYTVSNDAPWMLTVGGSTMDRSIRAGLKLGNGVEIHGESIFRTNTFDSKKSLPLFYPGGSNSNYWPERCASGTLNRTGEVDVMGKIVLCQRSREVRRLEQENEVKDTGGIAMILMNQELDGFSTMAEAHSLPVVHVSLSEASKLITYINSTSNPEAKLTFKGTSIVEKSSAPMGASFSSRGPSSASPGILKPDVIGPGVSILAAWPISLDKKHNPISSFNVMSGTSMSCPHLSGIAALLKSSHLDWSLAAIKSAIMTTADPLNREGPADP
ncbi:Subtilisin-like protease SDD1 [Morus notabilis]|uniref:Subtilisin-like protease SDD1 n=1 Tax=Morus notabilis TaxID=981085 RepID=W9RYJ4_9ROSA|nr:Subtilisin-like protease SDD1 [Morus notabilis]